MKRNFRSHCVMFKPKTSGTYWWAHIQFPGLSSQRQPQYCVTQYSKTPFFIILISLKSANDHV